MLCKDVLDVIENDYPAEYALEWDNVGLLAGRDDKEVERIYVAVDVTEEILREAAECGADLLITHHPLIFGGMKRVTNQDFIGRRILELIRQDISYYTMHTNYDVLRMARLAADMLNLRDQEVLDITCGTEGIGRIGRFEAPVTLKQCCEEVKRTFGLEGVRVFGNLGGRIERIAVCPGSGKSVIREALHRGTDVLITGDIGHHDGIDAAAQGMAVIDAGHYGIEHIFAEDMKRYLEENLQGVRVMAAPVSHPFAAV